VLNVEDKEVAFPSARYYSAVTDVLSDLRDEQISEAEAVKRIAMIEPDCNMDDCDNPVSAPFCRECERMLRMDD